MSFRILGSLLLIAMVSLLQGCGKAKSTPGLPVIAVTADTANWTVFEEGAEWLSLKVPDFKVQSDRDPDNIVRLEFARDELVSGFAVVRYEETASSGDIETSVRDQLGDTKKLLRFVPCSFKPENGSCVELADQKRWLDQPDSIPIYIKYFIQAGSRLYGIALSQNPSFNFTKGIGPQILSTLKLGTE